MSWGDEKCIHHNSCGYDHCAGQYGCPDFERDNYGDANSVIQGIDLSGVTNQALLESSALQQEIDKYKAVLRQAYEALEASWEYAEGNADELVNEALKEIKALGVESWKT
jgi:hypothetical protein